MKYILICIAALLVCFAIGFCLAKLVTKRVKKGRKGLIICVLTFIFAFIVMVVVTVGYMSVYYHATHVAKTDLAGNEAVTVTQVTGGYFFDGPGSDTAMVFYPGAKVECEAYASLLLKISENGIDCFLADMPFNFAIFGGENADKFLSAYDYDTWIMSGHSMGGLVAANYAAAHSDRIDGITLLASYPTHPVSSDARFLSIYGSEDGCLNLSEYENNRINWPADFAECVIDGGNHAQFGNYGVQKSDGDALISPEVQQAITAEAICDFWITR